MSQTQGVRVALRRRHAGERFAQAEILAERARKDFRILRDQRGHAPQQPRCGSGRHHGRHAVVLEHDALAHVQSGQHAQQGALARSAATDQRIAASATQ